jgi:uncharacterized protein with PIN domain
VKFLVDAQLPSLLARFLSSAGHDALYTTELAEGNRTTNGRIAELADDEGRVVVTTCRWRRVASMAPMGRKSGQPTWSSRCSRLLAMTVTSQPHWRRAAATSIEVP